MPKLKNVGRNRVKLTPDMLDGDAAILTVSKVEQFAWEGQNLCVLNFVESGDAGLILNQTMADALVAQLGDELDDWTDKRVPVEVREVEYEGEVTRKVYIMAAAEWRGAFRDAGEKVPSYVRDLTPERVPAPEKSGKSGKASKSARSGK